MHCTINICFNIYSFLELDIGKLEHSDLSNSKIRTIHTKDFLRRVQCLDPFQRFIYSHYVCSTDTGTKQCFELRVQNLYAKPIPWGIQDFPEVGANSQSGIIFSTFCRKLHENERIWIRGEGRVPGVTP